ncbi:MAG: 4-(cytidine 5'-diphospho)-2-C-methyl-D-erythritol kinase [Pseudomonadota bacterium]
MIKTYRSFAKINLFLYVLGRRNDGYHDLWSLMTRIDLYDDIWFDFDSRDISVSCSHPDVPEDGSNLAVKAAGLFYQTLKSVAKDVHQGVFMQINKRIPPGGGLGGGSSNAATVLMALNEYYNRPFTTQTLMKIGLQLGADVPFFIFGKPAVAKGVGEQLESVDNLKPYHLVLCDPGVAASTASVYKNIDFRLTLNQKDNIKFGLNVPLRGQEFEVGACLHNDLEESACRLYPKIRETKEEMALLLRQKVFMTGSGSSLFSLFSDLKDARNGFDCLSKKWAGSNRTVFLSSFI